MCSQIWLIALFIPALLWGHGKAADSGMQTDEDSRVGSESRNQPAGANERKNSTREFSGHVSVQSQNPVAENSVETVRVVEGDAKPNSVSKSGSAKVSSEPSANAKSAEVEKAELPGFVEPDLTNETYNQVRAKKPSIPSRFDGQSGYDADNENGDVAQRTSVFKLLGLPTVVFGLLFFVMWGIISGRIQRIMF